MIQNLLQVIPCLTEEQVDEVVSLINQDTWKPSTVFDRGLNCTVENKIRTSKTAALLDTDKAAMIMHEEFNRILLEYRDRLEAIHKEYGKYPVPGAFNTRSYSEPIQVLRYQPGEYYKWHSDVAFDKTIHYSHRTISIVLYLSDGFEGGGTEFPWGVYKPKKGEALVFPSNWCFPHQSQTVTSGEKIAAVTWYYTEYDLMEKTAELLQKNHENTTNSIGNQ